MSIPTATVTILHKQDTCIYFNWEKQTTTQSSSFYSLMFEKLTGRIMGKYKLWCISCLFREHCFFAVGCVHALLVCMQLDLAGLDTQFSLWSQQFKGMFFHTVAVLSAAPYICHQLALIITYWHFAMRPWRPASVPFGVVHLLWCTWPTQHLCCLVRFSQNIQLSFRKHLGH